MRDDRVYISDFDNDRVQAFTRDGKFLFAWGGSGAAPGQFHGPTGVAVDADGSVLVADHYNHRIQKFTADGHFVRAWSAGNPDAAPVGLAIDRENRIYSTDLDAGQIRVWSRDGKLVAQWGGLLQPWGIAIDTRGRVWVAEHGRDRLVAFDVAGHPLPISGATASSRYVGPMAVAATLDGSLLASDFQSGPLRGATGIALDPSGAVWAADPERHQITRFTPDAASGVPTETSVRPSPASLRLARSSVGRGSIDLRIGVPSRGSLTLQVFSPTGRLIWSAPRTETGPGERVVTWNGRTTAGQPASTGVYFVRVHLDTGTEHLEVNGRVVLIR